MIERFCEELDCTLSHRSNSHPGISMSRDEDDRNIAFLFFQPGLQLRARHLRHTDINNQARGSSTQIGCEEFFRGSEAPCDQSSRLHQVAQSILHGLVVVNDRYQSGRLVHRHAARLTKLPHLEQSNFRLPAPGFRRLDPYYRCGARISGGKADRRTKSQQVNSVICEDVGMPPLHVVLVAPLTEPIGWPARAAGSTRCLLMV
jgi:hypothetical protein